MWYRVSHWITSFGAQVLGAAVTLVVGYFIARIARQFIRKVLKRTRMPMSLQGFVGQIGFVSILIFAVIATLARFGI